MKNSNSIKLFGVVVILFISIFIYNSLNGNPIGYLKAKNNINEISKLDETNKEIAILRLINDLTFKEIGVITGKSENYCRVSFFRIKKKLGEVLKDE